MSPRGAERAANLFAEVLAKSILLTAATHYIRTSFTEPYMKVMAILSVFGALALYEKMKRWSTKYLDEFLAMMLILVTLFWGVLYELGIAWVFLIYIGAATYLSLKRRARR